MEVKQLIQTSHKTAVDKGWWDQPDNPDSVPAKLALVHSEVSEALEEYRNGKPLSEIYFRESDGKPEGFVVELADVVIRIADLCGRYGLDLETAIDIKAKFNDSRPYRHGNKKA